jgi:hypothetical protein
VQGSVAQDTCPENVSPTGCLSQGQEHQDGEEFEGPAGSCERCSCQVLGAGGWDLGQGLGQRVSGSVCLASYWPCISCRLVT